MLPYKNYYYLLAFLILSCTNEKSRIENVIDIISLTQFDIIENVDLPPSSLVKDKKYIKLHSDNIDLNFKEISKVYLKDNYIFILDILTSSLIIYDLEGNAVTKVGERGSGPNEYVNIIDFDVDKENNIYIVDGSQNKLMKFNCYLDCIKNERLPFEVDVIKALDNGSFLFGLSSWNKGEYEGVKIALTDSLLQVDNILSYYDEYIDHVVWISNYSFSENKNGITYNRPISDEVIQFSESGESRGGYLIDFGKERFPDKEKKDIIRNYDNLENYNFLKWSVIIEENYMMGHFLRYGETRPFFINRNDNKLYLGKSVNHGDMGCIGGYSDNVLITFIIPGTERAEEEFLPQDIKDHLAAGDFVICLYQLI